MLVNKLLVLFLHVSGVVRRVDSGARKRGVTSNHDNREMICVVKEEKELGFIVENSSEEVITCCIFTVLGRGAWGYSDCYQAMDKRSRLELERFTKFAII